MRIRNNTLANLSVGSKKTRGAAAKNYMVVPGESTLELEDSVWLKEFAGPAAKMLEAGNLEITKQPAKSDEQVEEEEASALEAARKLIAAADKSKPVTKVEVKPEAAKVEVKKIVPKDKA